jgi:cytochrome c5
MRAGLAAVLLLAACQGGTPAPPAPAAAAAQPPQFDDPHLAAGRDVWIGTCKGCHDIGVAGAPKLGDAAAWAPRIANGTQTLYAHALQGYFGPGGTMMPPRGGNDRLSDANVIAAVDYMIAASRAP